MSDFAHAFTFMGDHVGLLWSKTLDTLALSGAAVGVALVLALPLGLWLGHLHRASFVAITASNILRALPSLAMIAIGLAIFGIGFVNVMVALVVLAFPVILANTYTAIDGVDPDVSEAARGMGMTGLEALLRVELPLALPLIFAGIRTAVVYTIATSTLAAIAGGGGLGDIIFNQAGYRIEGVLAAAILVTALAFAAELVLAIVQRLVTPRGVRAPAEAPAIGPAPGTVSG
ncbi:MAG: ABC transporter permease [Thermoleophilaceae bacterium]